MAERGQIVTNEKTGEKAWWDGQKLTPIRVAPGTNLEGLDQPGTTATITDQPPPGNLPPPPDADAFAQAQQGGLQEALEFNRRALGIAIPTAATAATFAIPGGALVKGAQTAGRIIPSLAKATPTMLRTGAEMALGAGGETAAQAVGVADPSAGQIAGAAAAPLAARGVLGAAKGLIRGGTSLLFPQQARRAGVELAQRMFRGPESQALFQIARNTGPVPTRPLATHIQEAVKKEFGEMVEVGGKMKRVGGMATPSGAATKILQNLEKKFADNPRLDFGDILDEVQRLNQQASTAFANGNNVTGKILSKASSQILNKLDDVNPAIKAANAAFRRERGIETLSNALRTSNPTNSFQKLIEQDELFKGAFKADELRTMGDLVDRVARMPGQALGMGRATLQMFAEPAAEAIANPAGRALLQQLLKAPGFGAQSMAVLAQFMRAHTANPTAGLSQGQPQGQP